jgi:UDP-N-acetylmuramoyl-L-alanine---L-glutamate ligase
VSGVRSWADLRERRVALWGIGVEGRASLRRLRHDQTEPVVVDRVGHVLEDGTEVVGIDAGGFDLLARSEVVVKSPGISRYSDDFLRLRAAGPEIVGGLGLWLGGSDRDRVLCVGGTKGKSTTTALAGALLAALGCSYRLGGNIGVCPWDPEVDGAVDWWVVETSSYQAPDIFVGPKVVAVTSLTEDHLPWHGGSAESYYRDKLSLCTRPGVQRVVANGVDVELRARAHLLGPTVDWVEEVGSWTESGILLGMHNRRNAEIARRALRALGVPGLDDDGVLRRAFRTFVPLPSRLNPVAEVDGVTFVDDSISTTVLSAAAALGNFPSRRVGLLVGGLERNLDYRPLAELAARDGVRVFTMPTNGARIARVLRDQGVDDVVECSSVAEATRRAFDFARPGGVVLLSPAAASLDLFTGFRERGEAFAAAAHELAATAPSR